VGATATCYHLFRDFCPMKGRSYKPDNLGLGSEYPRVVDFPLLAQISSSSLRVSKPRNVRGVSCLDVFNFVQRIKGRGRERVVVTPWSVSHNTQLFGTNHYVPMMILRVTRLVNQPHSDP
jgi:hypothetical protein